jgi:hypothetical protein
MNFDLRLPIGMLFSFYGILLVGYGLITKDSTQLYERSLGMNINLGWGLVLLIFGAFMLGMGLRGRSAPPQNKNESSADPKVPTSNDA